MKISEIPKLLKEFHPIKNGDKKPEHFTYGSNRKVWWKCNRRHSYQSQIEMKGTRNRGCPQCYKVGVFKTSRKMNDPRQSELNF